MLRRLFDGGREERAITYQSLFLSDQPTYGTTLSGVSMSQATSVKIGVVYAAVRLIADSISTLPMDTFYRQNGERLPFRPRPAWVDQPDPDPSIARSDTYQMVLFSMLIAGNAYLRLLRAPNGDVMAFSVLDPMRVEPRRNGRGFVEFVWDSSSVIPAEDMIHITDIRKPGALKGVSRVDELKEVLGIARALDEFSARYFGSGTTLSGLITYPGDMTEEQATRLKDQFEQNSKGLRNAHRPNILSGGAKFEKMSSSAAEAQLVDAKKQAAEEVARIFKIQPSLLGVTETGARAYASVEMDQILFTTLTLKPYIAKLEEQLSKLLPGGAFLRFNMDGLLRGDLSSRFSAYSTAVQAGFMSVADIRRLEDMRPVPGSEALRVSLASVNIDAAGIVEQEKRVGMLTRLVQLGFDPAAALAAVGLPPIAHTGLPSTQLQQISAVDPEDPSAAYNVA